MNTLIRSAPHVEIVTANAALVDKLLSMNTRNRRTKEQNIARLKSDIENGTFFLTGSGVSVSRTGVLLDGQNRLIAIKQAGYPPVQFVLATGLLDESQRVIDRHSKRSLSDSLSMVMNRTVSNSVVALANSLHHLGATKGRRVPFVFSSAGTLTDTDVMDFVSEYGDIASDVCVMSGHARVAVVSALFIYALHERDKAIELCEQVGKGLNLSETSPAYRLRLQIERLKTSNTAGGRMELFRLAASACIHHSNGTPVSMLRPVESWERARWKWAIEGESIFERFAYDVPPETDEAQVEREIARYEAEQKAAAEYAREARP